MPSLRETLLRRLGKGQAENPLRVIGLSKEILKLQMPVEALHRHCLRQARDLFAMYHDDVREITPDIVGLQRRYSAAFNALKDPTVFAEALREFSKEHGEDREEEILLRRSLRTAQSRILELEQKLLQTQHDMEALELSHRQLQQSIANYFRIRYAPVEYTSRKFGEWSLYAGLEDEGTVAVAVRAVGMKSSRSARAIALELHPLFERVRDKRQELNEIFPGEGEFYVYERPYRRGKIYTIKKDGSNILGSVSLEAKEVFLPYQEIANIPFRYVSDRKIGHHLRPYLSSPSVVVSVSTSGRKLAPPSDDAEETYRHLQDKVSVRSYRKRSIEIGVKFKIHSLFLGFKPS